MKLKRLADPQVSPDGKWVALPGDRGRPGRRQRATPTSGSCPLAGGEPRRLTNHPRSDTAAALEPRRQAASRFLSAPRRRRRRSTWWTPGGGEPRKVTSLRHRRRRRALDRRRARCSSPRTSTPTAQPEPRPRRRLQQAEGWTRRASRRPRASTTGCSTATGTPGTTAGARHLLVVPAGRRRRARPHARRPRRAARSAWAAPTTTRSRPTARRSASRATTTRCEATSTNAELFVVPVRGRRRRAKIAGQPRLRRRAALQPGRHADRVPRPGARGLRGRPLAADGLRPRDAARRANLTERLRPPRGGVRLVARLAARSTSPPATTRASRSSRSPPRAGRCSTVRRRAPSATSRSRRDGRTLVATTARRSPIPPEIVPRRRGRQRRRRAVTRANDAVLRRLRACAPGESVTYTGAAGKTVQAWIVQAARLRPRAEVPAARPDPRRPAGRVGRRAGRFRWNAQVFASAGYVVFAPNPRGSIGWGQEFMDDINARLGRPRLRGRHEGHRLRGGAALRREGPHRRRRRVVRRLHGQLDRRPHRPLSRARLPRRRLRPALDVRLDRGAVVRGLGVRRARTGRTPRSTSAGAPARFVEELQDADARRSTASRTTACRSSRASAMFTALQRRGVPSRLLVFPDENHWVLKPANSVRWYQEVLGWLDRWTKPLTRAAVSALDSPRRWGHEEVCSCRDAALRPARGDRHPRHHPRPRGRAARACAPTRRFDDAVARRAAAGSRAMTYKAAMAGDAVRRRQGGDPGRSRARQEPRAARRVRAGGATRLGGRFHTGCDMGIDAARRGGAWRGSREHVSHTPPRRRARHRRPGRPGRVRVASRRPAAGLGPAAAGLHVARAGRGPGRAAARAPPGARRARA